MPALLLLVAICGMIACEGGQGMEVELDAFSGRPNPRWKVPPQRAAEYLKKIDSLPVASDAPHIPDLGFRGFILKSGERSMRVFRERIIVEGGGSQRIYRDTGGIQAELMAEARKRGFESVVAGN